MVEDARRLEPARTSPLRNKPSQKQPVYPTKNLSSEQPLSVKLPHRSIAKAAANGSTFFTPRQAAVVNRMAQQNNPLGTLGNHIEHFMQLKQIAQQAAHMFDPRSRAGVGNDLSMIIGGPEGDSAEMLNREMPAQFEKYSLAKAAAGGNLGHDQMLQSVAHDSWVARNHPDPQVRLEAIQRLHDHLFGGEVHATGDIPSKPENAPVNQMRETAARRNAIARAKFEQRQSNPLNRYNAESAQKNAEMRALRGAGIHPRVMGEGDLRSSQMAEDLTFDHMGRGPNHPDYAGEHPFPGKLNETRGVQPSYDAAGLIAHRQAILSRFYKQQAFNHGGYPN